MPDEGPPPPPPDLDIPEGAEKAMEKAKGLPKWVWYAGGAALAYFLFLRPKRAS